MRLKSSPKNLNLDSIVLKFKRNSLNSRFNYWKSKKEKRKELFRLLNNYSSNKLKSKLSIPKVLNRKKKKPVSQLDNGKNSLVMKGSSLGRSNREYPNPIKEMLRRSRNEKKQSGNRGKNNFYHLKGKFYLMKDVRKKENRVISNSLHHCKPKCEMLKIFQNSKGRKGSSQRKSISKIISISQINKEQGKSPIKAFILKYIPYIFHTYFENEDETVLQLIFIIVIVIYILKSLQLVLII